MITHHKLKVYEKALAVAASAGEVSGAQAASLGNHAHAHRPPEGLATSFGRELMGRIIAMVGRL